MSLYIHTQWQRWGRGAQWFHFSKNAYTAHFSTEFQYELLAIQIGPNL